MAGSNTTYERRDGTDCDHGINFEWQTTNLAYLRCEKLHRQWAEDNTSGVKSYFVANNVDGIGAFDDVVIRVEYPHQNEDKTKIIFVQCKHFINPKKVLLDKLLNRATVQKYFDSFIEVLRILNDHRAITCQTYNEIKIRKETKRKKKQVMERNTEREHKLRNLFQCKPQDCEFILYSNIILEAGFENTQSKQCKSISMEILNTAQSNKFNILLNAMQLEFLSNEQFVDEREMFFELRQEFAAKFRIIVNQVENVNLDVLKSIKPTSDIEGISPLLEEEIKLIFQNKHCNVITQNSQLLESMENFCKLKTVAKNEVDSFLHIPQYGKIFSIESIESLQEHLKNETQTKIYTSCIELEKLKLKQFVNSEVQGSKLLVFIKDESLLRIWSKARESRLYRNLNQIFVCFEDLYKFSDYDKDSKEVLIEVHHNNNIETSLCFAQFSDETSKSILNHAITFQGFTVTVNDIWGDKWRRCLDEETVYRILKREEITIGSVVADPFDCYVERKLRFKKFDDEVIDDENEKSESNRLTEDEIIAIENKNVFLLSGPAGMGKSTTIKSLALKYKYKNPTYFVYYIELNKHMNELKKYKQERDISYAIDFLARNILGTQQLEYRSFVYACLEKKNVALFFDAFDEISPDCEKKFSSFLKTLLKTHVSRIFVSSRPNFIGSLEKNLNQVSLIFLPFTLEDKIFFFRKYCEKLTKKNDTTNEKVEMENVFSRIIESMEDKNGRCIELMAIPLQLTMFAEIHFEKIREMTTDGKMSFSFKMDSCSLYNAFIKKHVERYLVEKRKWIMQDCEKIVAIRDEMRDAEELACKLICPDLNQTPLSEYSDAIVKMCNQVGLITNIDPPVFLHRTYGEFLAANWFVHCIMNDNTNTTSYVLFLCKDVLIDYEYREVRKFVNDVLCNKSSDEHDSHMVNPNVKILYCWNLGKTSLHIAAREMHTEILKLLVRNDPSKLNEIDIFGSTALKDACQSGCLKSVEILCLNNFIIQNMKDIEQLNLLRSAIEGNSADIFHLVVEKVTILSMNLPLHDATKKGNIQIVQEILCHNSNLIDLEHNDGFLPLHIACKHDHMEVAKYLLTQKSSLASVGCGKKRETPLHFAAANGNVELMMLLLQQDKTLLNKCDSDEKSPLVCALLQQQTKAAKFLLTFPNCVVSTGKNPLTLAAEIGNVELISLLLDHDQTLLNSCNSDEKSPLVCALLKQQTEAAKFLLTFPNCVVNTGENPLTLAAEIGDVDILRKIYNLDCTLLNKVGKERCRGQTPLLCALKTSNIEAAKFLLELPDCLLTVDLDEKSPLHYAAMNGNIEIIKLLINQDRSMLLKRNKSGKSALYYAIFRGTNEVARTLLEYDEYSAEGNIKKNELEIALRQPKTLNIVTMMLERDPNLINMEHFLNNACWFGDIDLVKYILPRTASALIFKGERNRCVLDVAAEKGNINITELLLEKFPTLLNQRNSYGRTALHTACKYANTEVSKLFLNHDNCQIDVYDDELQTPLHFASGNCSIQLMKMILERNNNLLNRQNKKGQTPLHLTLEQDPFNQYDGCEDYDISSDGPNYLLSWNCSVNVEDMNGKNPIHLASKTNANETIKLLIERDRALLNLQDTDGLTPLHYACKWGRFEAMSVLLNFPDCDINLTDNEGNSPLHHAVMERYYESTIKNLSTLVQRDRSLLTVKNDMDQTALHLAAEYQYCDVDSLEFLLSHVECKANIQDIYGNTALHSCIQGTTDYTDSDLIANKIFSLAKHDSSLLNMKNYDGQTPLHIAVTKNCSVTVEILVCFKADVHKKDNDNCTPLDLAMEMKENDENEFIKSIIDILQKAMSDNSNN